MLSTILSWLSGGIIGQFTKPLLEAYQARLKAQNDHERLEADMTIARLEAARDIALAEASDRWSATRVGRWLIVVPWGIWWAYGCLIQIINPLLGLSLTVVALPPGWDSTAMVLIPAIVIGDAAALTARRLRK
jgi:hypothetical protein